MLNSRVDSEVEILRSDATALAVIQAANLIRDPEFGPQLGMLEKIGIALGTDLDGNSSVVWSVLHPRTRRPRRRCSTRPFKSFNPPSMCVAAG
ncbi:hypothetical protein ACFSHQ_06930 [Gemmobacter lanyuensis]